MDNLRGIFDRTGADSEAADDSWDERLHESGLTPMGEDDEAEAGDEEIVRQEPPPEIGQDERRMQVRAYNHWASLLDDRKFPSIEDLEPENLPDFGPFSVLLDFTSGIEDPAVPFIGDQLAVECGTDNEIEQLSEVPSRSLLSRITDHYMQILANQAPIGFEAEFVNQRGATILYRGILLPYSSDDDTIDFIYGVINWKEMADQATTDELLLEIDQALGADSDDDLGDIPVPRDSAAMADWADGPGADAAETPADPVSDLVAPSDSYIPDAAEDAEDEPAFPSPTFGSLSGSMVEATDDDEDYDDEEEEADGYGEADPVSFAGTNDGSDPYGLRQNSSVDGSDAEDAAVVPAEPAAESRPQVPAGLGIDPSADLPQQDESDFGLYDCLAAARESAHAARSCEDRSRTALYDAVGRAYDVSLAADEEPEEFEQLVADNGLTVQERAPMTPVVKLVFGADYDKTRLTEYAAVLGHAHRIGVERGSLAGYLRSAEGGLKGVVTAERRLRREESGKVTEETDGPAERLAKKLRGMEPKSLDDIAPEGAEFGLVMIRRMPDGTIALLGEVADDVPLVERAGRKLVAAS